MMNVIRIMIRLFTIINNMTWWVVHCRKQNANFWLVCIAYSLSVSIYGVWSSLFGVILKDVMDEVQQSSSASSSSLSSLSLCRLSVTTEDCCATQTRLHHTIT